MRLTAGQPAPDFDATDTNGHRVRLSDFRGRKLLLAFHRFAACPFCNLRVHRLRKVAPELKAAGLSIVTLFQSPNTVIANGVGRQTPPFPIIGDPDMVIYDRYGIERSRSAVWKAAALRLPDAMMAMTKGYRPRDVDGDAHLIPASFLVDPNGAIAEAYYGGDIGDHLPFERIRAFAASSTAPISPVVSTP